LRGLGITLHQIFAICPAGVFVLLHNSLEPNLFIANNADEDESILINVTEQVDFSRIRIASKYMPDLSVRGDWNPIDQGMASLFARVVLTLLTNALATADASLDAVRILSPRS
jgi:hypothetical protein